MSVLARRDPGGLERLYRLSQHPEWEFFLEMVREAERRQTADAIQSADPHSCGRATMLAALREELEGVQSSYADLRDEMERSRRLTGAAYKA